MNETLKYFDRNYPAYKYLNKLYSLREETVISFIVEHYPNLTVTYNRFLTAEKFGLLPKLQTITYDAGTVFYRVVKYSSITNHDNVCWNYIANSNGRFNNTETRVLYLGTTEEICLKELKVKNEEKYYLFKIKVKKPLKLHVLCFGDTKEHIFLNASLNAFLIAINLEKNKDLEKYILKELCNYTLNEINKVDTVLWPFIIAINSKAENYYEITQNLINLFKNNNKNMIGLKYNSSYFPYNFLLELCPHFNVCIFEDFIDDYLELMKKEIKISHRDYSKFTDIEELINNFKS